MFRIAEVRHKRLHACTVVEKKRLNTGTFF
jgi:hypothetical protein